MAFAELSNVSGADQTVIAAPGAGYALRIIRLHFTIDAAGIVTFADGTPSSGPPTNRFIYQKFTGAGGYSTETFGSDARVGRALKILTANTALKVTASAGNLYGIVEYDTVASN